MATFEVHSGTNTGTSDIDVYILNKPVGYFAISGGTEAHGDKFIGNVAYMPEQFDMYSVTDITLHGVIGARPFEMSTNASKVDLSQTVGVSFLRLTGTQMSIIGGTETILDIEAESGWLKFDMESGVATSSFVAPRMNPYGALPQNYDPAAPKDIAGLFQNIKGVGTGSTDDTVFGSSRNDIADLGGGKNYFDGRGGTDTLYLTGTRDQYTITKTANGFVVSNEAQGIHTETVNVERIGFLSDNEEGLDPANGTLAFDTDGIAGQAYRIYQAAFDRTPDTAGLSYWIKSMDKGTSLIEVASGFVGSSEFAAVYGAHASDQTFVSKLYENVLGRAGEAAGIDYWTGQLAAGQTRADVLAGFSESAENIVGVSGAIADGIFYV